MTIWFAYDSFELLINGYKSEISVSSVCVYKFIVESIFQFYKCLSAAINRILLFFHSSTFISFIPFLLSISLSLSFWKFKTINDNVHSTHIKLTVKQWNIVENKTLTTAFTISNKTIAQKITKKKKRSK